MTEQTNDNRPELPGRNGGTLRPFRPGESGNPGGMKKGTKHFSTILRRMLEETINVEINGVVVKMTRSEALLLEKIRLATNSPYDAVRLRAIMDIEDRIDGKPASSLSLSDDTDGEENIVVFYIPNQHNRKRPLPDPDEPDVEYLPGTNQ
jgi:hypothetical protein